MSRKKRRPEFKRMLLSKLNPAKYNPRVISDAAMAGLKESIDRFGFVEPILVNIRGGKNVIIGGHQRFEVLTAAGTKDCLCVTVDLSVKDEKVLNLTLNNPAIQGEFIKEKDLDAYIDSLRDVMSDDNAFYALRINELKTEMDEGAGSSSNADDIPSRVRRRCKVGHVYQLGDHRLMCGDATVEADVSCLMAGEKADMIFTDPPYNVDYTGKKNKKIKNDNMKDSDFLEFLTAAFVNLYKFSKKGAAIYVAHADTEGLNFRLAFTDSGFKLSGCLIWKKNALVLGRSDYQWQHEPILYGWHIPGTHFWRGGRKQTTILNETDVITKLSKDEYSIRTDLGEIIVTGKSIKISEIPTTIIEVDKPSSSDEHPTMKPVKLIIRFVNNSSQRGGLILDLFMGSGSTMIAAEQLGRRCFGMELDPHYCDVVLSRWEKFTGKKAQKLKV